MGATYGLGVSWKDEEWVEQTSFQVSAGCHIWKVAGGILTILLPLLQGQFCTKSFHSKCYPRLLFKPFSNIHSDFSHTFVEIFLFQKSPVFASPPATFHPVSYDFFLDQTAMVRNEITKSMLEHSGLNPVHFSLATLGPMDNL